MSSSPELNNSFNYSHSSGLDSLLRKVLTDNPQVTCIDPCSQVADGDESYTRFYTPKKQQTPNIRYNKDCFAMTFPNRSPVGLMESPSKGRIVKSQRLENLMLKLEIQDNEAEMDIPSTSFALDNSLGHNSTNSSADSGLPSEDSFGLCDETFSPMKRSTLRRSLKSFKKKVSSPFKRSDSLNKL